MRNSHGIQSVRRAAAILKAFDPDRPTLGITQLATVVGLPKSTAYRLAATLQAEGLLRQDPETGRYALGAALHRIASALAATEPLIQHGRAVLEALGRTVGHTVSLAVLDDGQAHFVLVREGTRPIRATLARPGERLPLTVTAAGKVLLADLPPAEVQVILRRRGFPKLTPKSLTSRRVLDEELRQVREQGVGWSREECAVGLLSLAAPVRSGGRTIAAISIACPTNLVDGPALTELPRRVRQAAAQLSARLDSAGESGR